MALLFVLSIWGCLGSHCFSCCLSCGCLGVSQDSLSAPLSLMPKPHVHSSAPGVHVGDGDSQWLLGRKQYSRKLLGLKKNQIPPDISVDPDAGTLSFINASAAAKAYFVSVRGHVCKGAGGNVLRGAPSALAGDENDNVMCGREQHCSRVTTFVIAVAPKELIDVCKLLRIRSIKDVDIHSDIVELAAADAAVALNISSDTATAASAAAGSAGSAAGSSFATTEAPSASEPPPLVLGFPLEAGRAYLCSQAFDGGLTHFAHASTRHAIDFDAPVGTPALAVADGTVSED